MSLYYLILWNKVDILQKHFKKDHVHMRLWTRFYASPHTCTPTDLMGRSVADNLHLLVIVRSWSNSSDVIPELILLT